MDHMNQAIDNVVLQSLQAVTPAMVQDKHCFEVYGYDILLDSDLNPWLIEVNASPSVTADTPVDYDLKCGMLDDVMNIVDMERQRGGQEISIGGFDKIWDDGPVYRPSLPGMPPSKRLNSYLGVCLDSCCSANQTHQVPTWSIDCRLSDMRNRHKLNLFPEPQRETLEVQTYIHITL